MEPVADDLDITFLKQNPRAIALIYLYACEVNEIFFFEESHFGFFYGHFIDQQWKESAGNQTFVRAKKLCQLFFENSSEIDSIIEKVSHHWKISRIPLLDKNILRLGIIEIQERITPPKVAFFEYVDLAKRYCSDQSPQFVNGILDSAAKNSLS